MLRKSYINLSLLFILLLTIGLSSCSSKKKIKKLENQYQTQFESNTNYSASYAEGIAYYQRLASDFDEIQMNPFGMTDSGKPLHEVIISVDKDFDPVSIKSKGKTVLYINNAIHPGEPCGEMR